MTPILSVRHLKKHYHLKKPSLFSAAQPSVKAVDDVSFDILEGETLSLVGESGCGKTSLGQTIMRVHAVTSGEVLYRMSDGREVDLAAASGKTLKAIHREVRMIFQDPNGSLNPRMNVRDIVGEPIRMAEGLSGRALDDRVSDLLGKVGLRPEYLTRYPHAFSGGERQRIGIARALALNPRLVVADEAVSALDVSIQAQTLNLLADLKEEFGLTFLFIAHDLSVVRHISDRVAVMYVGRMVELTETEALFTRPRHPYTEALLSAVPIPDPRMRSKRRRVRLPGEVASPINPPSGCAFHPRCRFASEICKIEAPQLRTVDGGLVACHHAEDLTLDGVDSLGVAAE
ncbi:ABC transporter ATP-binding protein [Roseobacter sinensis]|uniref:ATP-binding cassette domain-containing protein n=1 Tax=Roseobacter sinensis TaxID=2931391 RepID=A0ABT3BFE7_9RHOB|nr:oligopeptide/dipeptide ABC transporter ATP-binding protein [Roseobacter sp. WL0113]MCV3272302.1 ATP-binding cassette domain-containing protein [Roseobacter sp. WL0113]